MKSIGLDVPVYIYLSMMGFKGYLMGAEDIRRGTYSQKTNDENILVQEKEIEGVENAICTVYILSDYFYDSLLG